MTRRFLILPEAQADIEGAALWYEDQRPDLGEIFKGDLFKLIDRIAELPRHFPLLRKPVRRGLLRRFPYAVYFIFEEGMTVVFAVLHQRRDPRVWKRRV